MKFLKYVNGIILIFCITFTVFYGKNKIASSRPLGETANYKGVLTLWQIDAFEGGTGSRKGFLLKVARKFEKQNEGVLVMVTNHTKTSAEQSILEGNYPDMISFGLGVEISNLAELSLDKTYDFKGGKLGEKTYAVPWCKGCYYVISNPSIVKEEQNTILENVVVSQGDYTQILTAVLQENLSLKNFMVKSPMDAYIDFTSGKRAYLIGTQRDIVRLTNRGMPYTAYSIKNYNDLYQYIAVTSTDEYKSKASKEFIKLLLDKDVQSTLNSIDMFSCFYDVDNENTYLHNGAKERQKLTLSAFTLIQELKQMQEYSIKAIGGDENALNKISKLII